MVRNLVKLTLCTGLMSLASGAAEAQGSSGTVLHYLVGSTDSLPDAAQWINDTCKPDEAGAIQTTFSQNGYGAAYSIHIFCRKGSGALGNVTYESKMYPKGHFEPATVQLMMAESRLILIGIYAGTSGNQLLYFKRSEAGAIR